MPLPFLKPEKAVAVIIAKRNSNGSVEDLHEEGEHEAGLMVASEDLIKAIHNKDSKAVADALKSAIQICNQAPEQEESAEEEGEE